MKRVLIVGTGLIGASVGLALKANGFEGEVAGWDANAEELQAALGCKAIDRALEKREAGARYHAVAEEGVLVRDIAEVIGRGLKVPLVALSAEQAAGHFGWLAAFVGWDLRASSAQTQARLGWHPTGPGLIADLEQMRYF